MGTAAKTIELRQELSARLVDARARTDELFRILRPEAIHDRPIPERLRNIFYLGHLEAFDWNLIRPAAGLDSFHPAFDKLFAFGIDPVDGGLPKDQPGDWPRREEIERYNQRVRQTMDAWLERAPLNGAAQIRSENRLLVEVAIEHRLMHAETLAYMLHQLPPDRKFGVPIVPAPAFVPAAPRMIEIPAGTATLGLPHNSGSFGWDNEFEQHRVEVPAFAIDAYKVTNAQFLQFLEEGGYQHRPFWNDADWEWKEKHGIAHPAFWLPRGDQWFYRTIFAEVPLPGDWPVYVSHAEATAYSRWVRKSLPTEAQFHRAAYGTAGEVERIYPWGDQPPEERFGNFDFCRWDPVSIGAHPAGRSAFDVAGLVGNGWEWTNTVFAPFAGFQPFPFYPGYSANFFDGQHYVIKGGSARTAACMMRRSFRNWFQPRYQYIYAGFRCVQN